MKKPPLWEVIRLGGHALNFGRVQEVHMLLLSCWSVSCWESKAQIFRVGTWEQSVLLFFFGTSAVELSLLVIYHLPVVPEIWGGGDPPATHTHTPRDGCPQICRQSDYQEPRSSATHMGNFKTRKWVRDSECGDMFGFDTDDAEMQRFGDGR